MTLTFRAWKKPQAKAGGRYRLWGDTYIDVTAVETVSVNAIGEEEAHRSGFDSREALLAYVRSGPAGNIGGSDEVYRVEFRYAGDIEEPAAEAYGDDDIQALAERLEGMDRRSQHGPWTLQALQLIEEMPRRRAGDLADRAGRERLKFKADVRKLKYMGLTRSLGTGYELTELGERVLTRLRKGPRSRALPSGPGRGKASGW